MTQGRRRRGAWGLVYGACVVAVVAALAVLSRTALDFERSTQVAAARARFQDRQRLALWRMDSFVLPLLSREAARPYFEYLAYYPQERSYNRFLTALEKGDVLTPSPLLSAAPEFVHIHFQVDPSGQFTSPQVPSGNLRDLAEATCLPVRIANSLDVCLIEAHRRVPLEEVRRRVLEAERSEEELSGRWLAPHPLPSATSERTQAPDPAESQARQKSAYLTKRGAQSNADPNANNSSARDVRNSAADSEQWSQTANDSAPVVTEPAAVNVGTLVPLWLGDTPDLFLFRRVQVGTTELLQGMWLDWAALQKALVGEVAELLPGARVEPLRSSDVNWNEREPTSLATIPVRLVAEPRPFPGDAAAPWRPVHGTLLLTWAAGAAALIGGGILLRASLALGERRRRFASAVTHELRTPLTTFRMYSEMLADDIVRAPEQRQVYLQTLKDESTRLATLVENVLSYARLEEGRGGVRRDRITLRALVERMQGALARRAADAGSEFVTVGAVPDAELTTDADAVAQILFNLVDNAAKYARGATPARIELSLHADPRAVVLTIRDFGPGIPPDLARRIFAPFDRGARNGDPTPGVGLGLALARGLAADLGGSLELAAVAGPGAAFALRLPR